MSDQQITALDPKVRDHINYTLIIVIAIVIADQLLFLVTLFVPSILGTLTVIADRSAVALVISILTLIFIRIVSEIYPSVNIDHELSPTLTIGSFLILGQQLVFFISSSEFVLIWPVVQLIQTGDVLFLFLDMVIYAVTGYFAYLILFRQNRSNTGYLNRVLTYLGNEILYMVVGFIVFFYLGRTFILSGFDTVSFSMPLKMVLVLLLSLGTLPIPEKDYLDPQEQTG